MRSASGGSAPLAGAARAQRRAPLLSPGAPRIANPLPRSVQLSLLMAVPLAFFLLTSHGPYIQLGLYHKYMRQHRCGARRAACGALRCWSQCERGARRVGADWTHLACGSARGAAARCMSASQRSWKRRVHMLHAHVHTHASTRPARRPPRGFYLSCLLAACAFASAGAYRLALAHAGTPPLLVWRQPGYHALWAAARACLLLFYCAAARAAALSLRPEGEAWLAAAAAAGLGRR